MLARAPARRFCTVLVLLLTQVTTSPLTAAWAEVAPPASPPPLVAAPTPAPASPAPSTQRLVDIQASTLANGLRLWLQRTPGSDQAHVRFVVQAGSGVEPESANGVAHFLEHMLFDRETDPAIHGLIQRIEANGGYYNAFTTLDVTYAVVDTFAADLESALELVTRSLDAGPFTPEQIEIERQIVGRELSEKQDDALLLAVRGQLYGDQALARPEGGTPESIERISARQLRSFFQTHYRPPALVLIVLADRAPEEIRAAIDKTLGRLSWSGRAPPPYSAPERTPGPIQVDDVEHSGALLHGVVTSGARDADYYPLWVLQELLEIRLYDRIRVHGGMSYAPYVYFTPNRHEGLLYLYASADDADFGAISDAFDNELSRVSSGEIAQEEIQEARQRVSNRFLREHRNGEELANHLAWLAGVLEPNELPQDPIDSLRRVSRKELKRVADRWGAEEFRIDARFATEPGSEPKPSLWMRLAGWALPAGGALLLLMQILMLARMRALGRTVAAASQSRTEVTASASKDAPKSPSLAA